ncbi:hypothetical protein DNH61_21290 [Paenibacillus sambharensis]|uniref:DNA-binding response regulator n=1 Tax=Paenibacillus sambharensis TaxID=1803190 RepID=A0A2W1LRF8_9BACL|nr:response regulator [Paenibacillus sambharensis]PZD94017.1 hypothetical protein DNH61_21290 [Paenibacillus sambharensis]
MKKVMLVDDEVLVRENIRKCVDWDKEQFIYCGDASDGEVALPLIEEWMPDILITDIKMPFMDGLELTSVVRSQFPEMKVIIMSGHDEFAFAQNALRLGVEDYCLKPVSADDLIAMLNKISDKIDKEYEQKQQFQYTEDKLLADLCGGLIGTPEAIEIAARLSVPITARYYAVIVTDLRITQDEPNAQPAFEEPLQAAVRSYLQDNPQFLFYTRSRTELVCILKGNSEEAVTRAAQAAAEDMRAIAENDSCCCLHVGIGSVQERLQGIHVSYLEADEDKTNNRLRSRYSDKLQSSRFLPEQVLLDREQFLAFVKLGTPANKETFLEQFSLDLAKMNWESSSYGCCVLNDLTLDAIRTAKQTFRPAQDTAPMITRLQIRLGEVTSWESCKAYLSELLDHVWRWRTESSGRYSEIIEGVRDYIHKNYHNDQLGLKDMAVHVRLSPSHLSKIYSQETGQTLTEYLTQTRMKKAKELLAGTSSKTFEIAYESGYSDHHYFSNLFKKHTGMTPTEYRKQRNCQGMTE